MLKGPLDHNETRPVLRATMITYPECGTTGKAEPWGATIALDLLRQYRAHSRHLIRVRIAGDNPNVVRYCTGTAQFVTLSSIQSSKRNYRHSRCVGLHVSGFLYPESAMSKHMGLLRRLCGRHTDKLKGMMVRGYARIFY